MATHSNTLAWKIPWMEEPGRLQSVGLLGVGHDRATSLSLFQPLLQKGCITIVMKVFVSGIYNAIVGSGGGLTETHFEN